jgi:K+-transporting ATPase KdpF subunit
MDCRRVRPLGSAGRPRAGAAHIAGAAGRAPVIGLDVLYGLGGLIAVILFAYLVFALICAEEF